MKTIALILAVLFICTTSLTGTAQPDLRSQSLYFELGGGGIGFSANYEFRFRKNQMDGLGLRAGIGGLHIWFFEDISITSVPVELNYIFSDEHLVSFELGLCLTYTHVKQDFSWFSSDIETSTDNLILGYIPVGVRLLPEGGGLTARANMGPLMNLSAPNLFADNSVLFMLGISVGYMF